MNARLDHDMSPWLWFESWDLVRTWVALHLPKRAVDVHALIDALEACGMPVPVVRLFGGHPAIGWECSLVGSRWNGHALMVSPSSDQPGQYLLKIANSERLKIVCVAENPLRLEPLLSAFGSGRVLPESAKGVRMEKPSKATKTVTVH